VRAGRPRRGGGGGRPDREGAGAARGVADRGSAGPGGRRPRRAGHGRGGLLPGRAVPAGPQAPELAGGRPVGVPAGAARGPKIGGTFGTVACQSTVAPCLSSMYLRTYVDLPLDFDVVRAALIRGRLSCLSGAARAAENECAELLAAAGLSDGGRSQSWPTAV